MLGLQNKLERIYSSLPWRKRVRTPTVLQMEAVECGAAALGIKNCLCIAGDHQSFSAAGKLKGHPGAKNVYDLDSLQLVNCLKGMRDDGVQQGGDPLAVRPPLFVGAAWTPMGDLGQTHRVTMGLKFGPDTSKPIGEEKPNKANISANHDNIRVGDNRVSDQP